MPTALIVADHSEFTRSFVQAMKTSEYFRIIGELPDEEAGRAALAQGASQFVVTHSARISRRSCCAASGPSILLEADASDPTATGAALAASSQLVAVVVAQGPDRTLRRTDRDAAAVRRRGAPPLQPRIDHAIQHRAGSHGRDPHHDARDDDRPRDHARARARHDGEPARDAVDAARGDDGQDRSLHRDRPHPGDDHPARGAATSSTCRSSAASPRSMARRCCSSRAT